MDFHLLESRRRVLLYDQVTARLVAKKEVDFLEDLQYLACIERVRYELLSEYEVW